MAKKAYSLDYSIKYDTERVTAVYNILDQLEKNPNESDLEQMANYILYGKDENDQNIIQRGESTNTGKRYNSYKTADDKVLSLDEILENPMFDEQQIRSARQRNPYKKPENVIKRPKYDKTTGELIDPGDSDIPGMVELWESIDRLQRQIDVAQGKVVPNENDLLFDDSYRLYRLKHNLIDIRRHQYYLKDSYKPTIHFQNIDHPKPQFYDWCGDSFYWMPYAAWEERIKHSYLPNISHNIEDYEIRGEGDTLEVKWVVCKHRFDWEDPIHIRAFMLYYEQLKEALNEKLNTYGRTLIWDFERYLELAEFTPLRLFIIDEKLKRIPYDEMLVDIQEKFGILYNKNHLSSILTTEIPNRIAMIAKRERLLVETPMEERKKCHCCQQYFPRDNIFFSSNRGRKDGLASNCKRCEKARRLTKEGGELNDRRSKDAQMFKMQTGEINKLVPANAE